MGDNLQPIKLVRTAEPGSSEEAATSLQVAIGQTLRYSHDLADDEHGAVADKFEESLVNLLRERFFKSLYVPQPAVGQILTALKVSGLSVVTGSVGCGKTTALMRVRDSLGPRPSNEQISSSELTRDVIYCNLRDRSSLFGRQGNESVTVCDELFEAVQVALFPALNTTAPPGVMEEELRGRWLEYRVLKLAEYRKLRNQIADIEHPGTLAEWREVIASDEYKEQFRKANADFLGGSAVHRLSTILNFMREELNHSVTFLVDNIDRYPVSSQREVLEKSTFIRTFESSVRFALAYRDSNLARFHSDPATQDRRDFPYQVIRLADHLAPDETDYQRNDDFDRIVEARFKFLIDVLSGTAVTWATEDGDSLHVDGERVKAGLLFDANQLGFAEGSELVEAQKATFTGIRSLLATEFEGSILAWHNGSIRSATSQLSEIVSSVQFGNSPLFVAKGSAQSKRQTRTVLWRHLIFGQSSPPHRPDTPTLFRGDGISVLGKPVPFQRWHILRLLKAAPRGSMKLDELVEQFELLGIARGDVQSNIVELGRSRGYESGGLVELEVSNGLSVVAATTAGRYFCNRLAHSVEYLFWQGMFEDIPGYEDREPIGTDLIRSDAFRLSVAIDFVNAIVMPRTTECLQAWAEISIMAPQSRSVGPLLEVLGLGRPLTNFLYAYRCVGSLEKFLQDDPHVSAAERAALSERLAVLQNSLSNVLSKYSDSLGDGTQ